MRAVVVVVMLVAAAGCTTYQGPGHEGAGATATGGTAASGAQDAGSASNASPLGATGQEADGNAASGAATTGTAGDAGSPPGQQPGTGSGSSGGSSGSGTTTGSGGSSQGSGGSGGGGGTGNTGSGTSSGTTGASGNGTSSPPASPSPAPGPSPAPSAPPAAGNITVDQQHLDRFRAGWTVPSAANSSWVEYGTTTSYGSSTAVQAGSGSKHFLVTGLQQATLYHFRVMVQGTGGTTASSDQTTYTATQVNITIVGQAGAASFTPQNPSAPADRPLVLHVTNQLAQSHTYVVMGGGPASPPIAAGASYTSAASFVLDAGPHTHKCTLHPSTMTGTGSFVAS